MEILDFSNPWFWAILGVTLLITEVFTQVLIMLFFGIGALVVALGAWKLGLLDFTFQVLTFSVVGSLGLLLFRRRILANFRKSNPREYQIDQHQTITLTAAIPARGQGFVQYQGAPWTAINDSDNELAKGSSVTILRIDGTKIYIKQAAR